MRLSDCSAHTKARSYRNDMPSLHVEADEFLTHRGVSVYHVYKDDDADGVTREFWYTLDPVFGSDDDDDQWTFDVRDLATYPDYPRPADAIRKAIDAGLITNQGVTRA